MELEKFAEEHLSDEAVEVFETTDDEVLRELMDFLGTNAVVDSIPGLSLSEKQEVITEVFERQ